jgi:hypothetical protein
VLLEKTWSMLDGFRAPQVSSNFTSDLMARIPKQVEVKPKLTFPEINILRVLAPVLVSVCAFIVGYLVVQNYMIQNQQIAKVVSPEQKTIMQAKESVSAVSKVNVAEVTPSERTTEVMKVAVKIVVPDEEIIRHLDVYQNIELYQNYALVKDLDVVENLSARGL